MLIEFGADGFVCEIIFTSLPAGVDPSVQSRSGLFLHLATTTGRSYPSTPPAQAGWLDQPFYCITVGSCSSQGDPSKPLLPRWIPSFVFTIQCPNGRFSYRWPGPRHLLLLCGRALGSGPRWTHKTCYMSSAVLRQCTFLSELFQFAILKVASCTRTRSANAERTVNEWRPFVSEKVEKTPHQLLQLQFSRGELWRALFIRG